MKSNRKRIVLSTGMEIPCRKVGLWSNRRARASSKTACLTYSFECNLGTREEYNGLVDACSLFSLVSRRHGLCSYVLLVPKNNMNKILFNNLKFKILLFYNLKLS